MSEHWYTKTGEACHTQPTKKGAKNPTRATTIADARKMGLFPSVSGIIRMAYNPMLERWKQGQIIKACYECSPGRDESLDDYERHILEVADRERDAAADLGTRIHAGIESYYTKKDEFLAEDIKDPVFAAVSAVEDICIKPQKHEAIVVCHRHGYAGTTDMVFLGADGKTCGILDFKSTKTKPGEPILPKLGHAAQIAAYHVGHWELGNTPISEDAVGYNIYVSTTEPGRVEIQKYTYEQLRNEWEWFQACLTLWRHKNKYDPRHATH